jgi:hypothetical protein
LVEKRTNSVVKKTLIHDDHNPSIHPSIHHHMMNNDDDDDDDGQKHHESMSLFFQFSNIKYLAYIVEFTLEKQSFPNFLG